MPAEDHPQPSVKPREAAARARVLCGRFLVLAGAAFLLRLLLSPWTAHVGDVGTFIGWGDQLASKGIASFYGKTNWCDYLPGYLYVLWLLGKVHTALHITWTYNLFPLPPSWGGMAVLHLDWVLFKLPSMLADVVTAFLIWRLAGPTKERLKLWAPALYLFNPAVLGNSTLWGQVDSFHALTLVGGLALLTRRRVLLAAVVLGFSVATKPHSVVVLPLALLFAVYLGVTWWRTALAVPLTVAVCAAMFLPFADFSLTGLWHLIEARANTTMGQYDVATANSFNLWYLLGQNWQKDSVALVWGFSARQIGTALFAVVYAGALAWLHRRRRAGSVALWEVATLVYLGLFLFITRAHERHIFPVFVFFNLVVALRGRAVGPYVALSLSSCVNLIFAWRYMLDPEVEICHPLLGRALCVVNIALLPITVASLTDRWVRARDRVSALVHRISTTAVDSRARRRLALLVIVAFALLTRVARLNAPDEQYFDEVYHAYTANEWVKGNTDAWLWSPETPPAEGHSYEWTHPPLAKLIMAEGIRLARFVTGQSSPWGWRLPAAILGTLCVPLVYWIAVALFDSSIIGLLAAAFMSLDTLPLFSSRIGMNDIYCVFFILCAVLAALRNRPLPGALAVGLGIASKWTALYALPLLAVIHLVRLPIRRWPLGISGYLILVPVLYVGSYVPFFRAGHNRDQLIELHRQMWFYHTRLVAHHPFASKAWEWPLGSRPLWAYTHTAETNQAKAGEAVTSRPASGAAGQVANIYAMGNPLIWWAGAGAVLFAIMEIIRRLDKQLILLVAGYMAFWSPWLASPRIMFIYHYLPSLPFLYIALAWALVRTAVPRTWVLIYLLAVFLVFAAMYPYVTAVYMPASLSPTNWQWIWS